MRARLKTTARRVLVLGALALATSACGSSGRAPDVDPPPSAPSSSVSVAPPSTVAVPASGTATQPAQRTSGPGGSAVAHRDWRVSSGGTGDDAWYAFEPVEPTPRHAPVAIVMHGYSEFEGYASLRELIRHTVLSGSVVIYPRWQTGVATPCPGPYDIDPCITSAVNGIRGALDFLHAGRDRVQPDVDRASYFGFSFGGIIAANLANRHGRLDVPVPRAVFLDDPHDGGLTGGDEPALDDSMAGIPSDVLVQCHVGAEGVISEAGMAGASCNALFPKLGHVPDGNKDLVLTRADGHGDPDLSARHGVCTAFEGRADAYDWNFCWKTWDALRSAAEDGTDREYALGDTPEHRDNGRWSDDAPIAPLKIQDRAPIRP